jgi:hypothetical protein
VGAGAGAGAGAAQAANKEIKTISGIPIDNNILFTNYLLVNFWSYWNIFD